MRPRAPKRTVQMRKYVPRMKAFLEDNPLCVRCGRPSSELHHARGRRGEQLLVEADWRALCHDCHQWVTEHPRDAVSAGLSALRVGTA